MDVMPIIKAMRYNKVGVALLVLEIAVTTAVTVNCVSLIRQMQGEINRPTGIDEHNLITIQNRTFGDAYAEDSFRQNTVNQDLKVLRSMPEVIDASGLFPFPLQGGGSSGTVRPLGADISEAVRAPMYYGDTHMLDTLGLALIEGRNLMESDLAYAFQPQSLNVVVTKDLADALFPNGDALGKTVISGDPNYPHTIVGIVRHMHTPYGGGPMETRIAFLPFAVTNPSGFSYMVRAKPGQLDNVMAQLEARLLKEEPQRVIQLRPLMEIKRAAYNDNRGISGILTVVIVLLGVVTAIGILGMTSFTVTRRTKQIGIRRALGATKREILRYFLLENSLIATLGILVGVIVGYALNSQMVKHAGAAPLDSTFLVVTALFIWCVGVVATLLPAMRGAKIPPAIASRTV